MKRIGLFFACFLFLLVPTVSAQSWGCPERDYKCQLDVVSKALKDDPKNPENYYNIGIVLQRSRAYNEAIESFSMYVSIPGLKAEFAADGYNNRGICYRASKRPDLAYTDYTKAIELNPKSPIFLFNRGNASVDLKKYDQAIADYDRAIILDPKYAPAYAGRGNALAEQSKPDEAIKAFSKAIEVDPNDTESYYNRGFMYSGKSEFAKAIADYDKYIALLQDNPVYLADGLMNRGLAHFYSGSAQKAVEDFTRVIAMYPNNAGAYKARAKAYRGIKKDDLAVADEKKATQLTSLPK
ncbi:MAG TPA: tetratricopeptide repeat protein [Pyrinomonadaceae bacterium]|nr:tetratricopeptide repeat protein [Pyrinomonadaceae bacterium]